MLPTDDPFGRIDTQILYQPFLEKLSDVYGECEKRGAHYFATCGVRTYAEQDKLYAIGRTTGIPGHYVTKAKGGYGPHNFLCAVDSCLDANFGNKGLKPDYRDESYRILGEEAERMGLESGFFWTFKDTPHVQLPLRKRGVSWAMLRTAYTRGGYPGVIKLLDAHGPW